MTRERTSKLSSLLGGQGLPVLGVLLTLKERTGLGLLPSVLGLCTDNGTLSLTGQGQYSLTLSFGMAVFLRQITLIQSFCASFTPALDGSFAHWALVESGPRPS